MFRWVALSDTYDPKTLISSNLQLESELSTGVSAVAFVVTFKCRGKQTHEDIMHIISSMDGLAYIEEL